MHVAVGLDHCMLAAQAHMSCMIGGVNMERRRRRTGLWAEKRRTGEEKDQKKKKKEKGKKKKTTYGPCLGDELHVEYNDKSTLHQWKTMKARKNMILLRIRDGIRKPAQVIVTGDPQDDTEAGVGSCCYGYCLRPPPLPTLWP